jgi:hypothetical protein
MLSHLLVLASLYIGQCHGQNIKNIQMARTSAQVRAELQRNSNQTALVRACQEQIRTKQVPWSCYAADIGFEGGENYCKQRARASRSLESLPNLEQRAHLPADCRKELEGQERLLKYKAQNTKFNEVRVF